MSESPSSRVPLRRLPQQPNLKQLRKQAKDLLEQYRAGDTAAIAEVQQFEHEPDPADFSLHDAQRVLARAYGYPSWPKLKAFVDGVNIARFMGAVKAGDMPQVRSMLASRPELIGKDVSESNEHRAIHYAVLQRDIPMVRLLMEAGADARKGIFPHRDATSALCIARDRGYDDVIAVIEEEERLRREEMSCPNATVSPVQDQISAAIVQGDHATAMRLLEADLSLIQACDRSGATPLHLATQQGDAALVEWLLQRRDNVRKKDLHDLTALDRAALSADPRNQKARQFPEIARLLLEHGAEMTIRGAVALGDAARIQALIAADASLLRLTGPHCGLLSLAVNHGHLEVVRLLLDLGADVDERILLQELEEPTLSWGQPLWSAALANQYEIAKLLLDRGADPNANVYASGWPLRNAWNHEGGAVKRLLLERGAKPQPYMVAETHDVVEAKRLLAADPSEQVVHELLWSAAEYGCPAIVEMALPHLEWPLDDPRWHWVLTQPVRDAGSIPAENEGRLQSLRLLLQHGVDPNIARYGQTTLHFTAARNGVGEDERARFVSLLIDYGARLDLRDDLLKSTPLGWACRWGRRKMVEMLIERGASVDEPDAEAWATPKAWARKMKQDDIFEILEGR